MNIVSVMAGMTIMGVAAPQVVNMSIQPFVAQKRAQNLGQAESSAVTFAAANEGQVQLTGSAPDGCELTPLENSAYEITCTEGEDTNYVQSVTRAFRLFDPSCDNDGNNGHGNSGGNDCSNPGNGKDKGNTARSFSYPQISGPWSGHQCNSPDEWGIAWSINWPTLSPCIPQDGWTKEAYLASDPDDWLYDINNIRGFGQHPDY
jgi:hypothetical protein